MDSKLVNHFFRLASADKKGAIRVKPSRPYEALALKTGIETLSEPLLTKIDEGTKFYDVLCLQDPHNFAVSGRIYDLMIENNITGWRSYQIVIEGCGKQYYGIQITGQAGPILHSNEGFVVGLSFDEATWDGTDVFVLKDTALTIVSPRFQKLLVNAKATNMALMDLKTFRWYSTTSGKK